MSLSETARKVFAALPADDTKIGNGKLQKKLDLGRNDLDQAKAELKEEGLVVLGKGRGGSLGRAENAELPPEEEKLSPDAVMEIAREAKAEKSREEKQRDLIRERIVALGKNKYPEAVEIVPGLYEHRRYMEVWTNTKTGHRAGVVFLTEDEQEGVEN